MNAFCCTCPELDRPLQDCKEPDILKRSRWGQPRLWRTSNAICLRSDTCSHTTLWLGSVCMCAETASIYTLSESQPLQLHTKPKLKPCFKCKNLKPLNPLYPWVEVLTMNVQCSCFASDWVPLLHVIAHLFSDISPLCLWDIKCPPPKSFNFSNHLHSHGLKLDA